MTEAAQPAGAQRPPQTPPATAEMIQIDTLPVHNLVFAETVERIVAWGREGSGGYVTTPNVDHVVRARRSDEFRQLVMGARLRVPDGMGIVYGARLAGTPLRGTVTGRWLPEAIVRATLDDPLPIALLGGQRDAPQQAAAYLERLGGRVVASIGPPMGFEIGGAQDEAAVEQLRQAAPRVLFVGLGAPKQERWMARHQAALPRTVMVGVGQAIDVLGGVVPAAPAWMTRVGVEWFFRLLHHPRRIGRRILVDDPPFFWWMLRQRLRDRRRG